MTVKRFFLTSVLVLFCAAFLIAEPSDHSNIFPKTRGWDIANFYMSEEGRAAPPVGFKGRGSWLPVGWDASMGYDRLVAWGGGISVDFGYDWDGWLFSVNYSYLSYSKGKGEESLMNDFTHNMLRAGVSKIITHDHLLLLPAGLDLRLQFGLGVDFIDAFYYASLEAKQAIMPNKKPYNAVSAGFLINAGVFFEISKPNCVTPYFGVDFNMVTDEGGLFFMPSLILGVRLCKLINGDRL